MSQKILYTKLPKAEDRKLKKKLQEVLHSIKKHDMTSLIKLLSKEDRPDLNYLVPVKSGGARFYKEWVSPLQYACERGTPEMAGAILAAGAMVNIKPHSPLTYAICSFKVALVHRLLKNGASPRERGDPNVWDMAAAMTLMLRSNSSPEEKQKQREIITLLCNAGCDVNMSIGPSGETKFLDRQETGTKKVYQAPLLFYVVSEGDLELCKVFLDAGAEVNVQDSMYDKTALSIAVTTGTEENLPVTELLLAHGADPNQLVDGSSILHLAVKQGRIKTVQVLLQAGANRAALDKDGCTPLHYAASGGQPELIKLLALSDILDAPDNNGLTPLHLAADNGNLATVQALVAAGVDIAVETPVTKVSPLDMALHNKHQKVAEFLMKLKGNNLLETDGPVIHSSMPELSANKGATTSVPKTEELQEENHSLKEKLKKQEEETEQLKLEANQLKQEAHQLIQERDQLKEEINGLKEQLRDQITENNRKVLSLQKQLQKFQVIQYEENSNPVPMSDSHKQALTTNWPQFLEDLQQSVVVPSLVAEGILTPHMEEEIKKAYHTKRDRNAHLLDTLLTRGDQAFYVFRQALRKDPGSEHLALLLNVD